MFSRTDETLSRDSNLNFSLSDANSMQILDNQKKKEKNVPAVKFSSRPSSLQNTEKEARKKEYDNYINTFTSGQNKNDIRQKTFNPPKLSAQGESSATAISKSLKKTSSMESPGTRKLIRTPTQVMK